MLEVIGEGSLAIWIRSGASGLTPDGPQLHLAALAHAKLDALLQSGTNLRPLAVCSNGFWPALFHPDALDLLTAVNTTARIGRDRSGSPMIVASGVLIVGGPKPGRQVFDDLGSVLQMDVVHVPSAVDVALLKLLINLPDVYASLRPEDPDRYKVESQLLREVFGLADHLAIRVVDLNPFELVRLRSMLSDPVETEHAIRRWRGGRSPDSVVRFVERGDDSEILALYAATSSWAARMGNPMPTFDYVVALIRAGI